MLFYIKLCLRQALCNVTTKEKRLRTCGLFPAVRILHIPATDFTLYSFSSFLYQELEVTLISTSCLNLNYTYGRLIRRVVTLSHQYCFRSGYAVSSPPFQRNHESYGIFIYCFRAVQSP